MFITSSKLKYKTYTNTDPEFHFSPNDITLVGRAGLEINEKCPTEYKQMLMTALDLGWIKLVANQPVHEHFMEELTK